MHCTFFSLTNYCLLRSHRSPHEMPALLRQCGETSADNPGSTCKGAVGAGPGGHKTAKGKVVELIIFSREVYVRGGTGGAGGGVWAENGAKEAT